MDETWSSIKDHSIPHGRYEVIEIVRNFEGFRIELDDEINRLHILFPDDVLSVRICDEGDRLKTIDPILSNIDGDFFVNWPLYRVEHSQFSQWFEGETYGIINRHSFTHFVVVTANDVIDILSLYHPTITVSTM